jgi:hypothetical protein
MRFIAPQAKCKLIDGRQNAIVAACQAQNIDPRFEQVRRQHLHLRIVHDFGVHAKPRCHARTRSAAHSSFQIAASVVFSREAISAVPSPRAM